MAHFSKGSRRAVMTGTAVLALAGGPACAQPQTANATARKFDYPQTVIAEHGPWLVLLRPEQPTLGSLVLVCQEQATAFSALSTGAFADLGVVVGGVERMLRATVSCQKINYLMLMMSDPDVHFHVIPRYDGERTMGGKIFKDVGWPGQPVLNQFTRLAPEDIQALTASMRREWRV